MKVIDGSALYRALEKMLKNEDFDDEYEMGQRIGIRKAMTEIEHAEAVDAVPVRHGKWIDHTEEGYVECNQCHSATNCDGDIEELNYCWNCGAKMDVREEE